MTWSIIARDNATGQFGIAVATRFFAVGARVPHIAAGIGGIATQALVNPYYGIDGVKLLREGRQPARHHRDPDRGRRRPREPAAAHHGCQPAASPPIPGATASTGAGISRATAFPSPATCWPARACWTTPRKPMSPTTTLPFAQRLIAAMRAGEAAGGDKRGKQSAALLIYGEEEWSELDLRVDDHADPLAELERLEAVSRERWVHFRKFLPSRAKSGRDHRSRDHRRRHRSGDRGPAMTDVPLIEIEGSAGHLPRRRRPHHPCGRPRRSQRRQRRDARPGRRIRLRQERDLARHHGAVVEAIGRGHRLDPLRRLRSARRARPDPARPARQPAGDDLPGADDLAQSELHHRRADHRDHPAPSRRLAAQPRASARSSCCAASTSPRRSSASTNIRTSCPAACASAS